MPCRKLSSHLQHAVEGVEARDVPEHDVGVGARIHDALQESPRTQVIGVCQLAHK